MSKLKRIVATSVVISSLFINLAIAEETDNVGNDNMQIKPVSSDDKRNTEATINDVLLLLMNKASETSEEELVLWSSENGLTTLEDSINGKITKSSFLIMLDTYIKETVSYSDMPDGITKLPEDMQRTIFKLYYLGIVSHNICINYEGSNTVSYEEARLLIDRAQNKDLRLAVDIDMQCKPYSYSSKKITLNTGRDLTYDLIEIDMNSKDLSIDTSLANGQVGGIDSLNNIAEDKLAIAAINGASYNIYDSSNNPFGVIVHRRRLLHGGSKKPVFFFNNEGMMDIRHIDAQIDISVDNEVFSSLSGNTILNHSNNEIGMTHQTIYTPEYGMDFEVSDGRNIISQNGYIKSVSNKATLVPEKGFLYSFNDKDLNNELLEVGRPFEYSAKLLFSDTQEEVIDIYGAIGGMDLIVNNGEVADVMLLSKPLDTYRIPRTAIGIGENNRLLMIYSEKATLIELANMMKAAGATKAMNISNGANASLYFRGKQLHDKHNVGSAIVIKMD